MATSHLPISILTARPQLRSWGVALLWMLITTGCALRPTAIVIPESSEQQLQCTPDIDSLALQPKRIAVIHFPVEDEHYGIDLPGIGPLMAKGAVNKLSESKKFLVENATHVNLIPNAISPLGKSGMGEKEPSRR